MIHRILKPIESQSFFLFGARGTGKTTLLKHILPPSKTLTFDLLDPEIEDRFARNPSELREILKASSDKIEWVFIDEIQKLPKLLNIVHKEIEESRFRFAMTGSSARKIKRGAANLLAGRAFMNYLFPLTHVELGNQFNLKETLEFGTLPKITQLKTIEEKRSFLRTYSLVYLKEEIRAEQIVRKLDPFRQFLEIAAQTNGEIINYTNIARDVNVDTKTVQSYFQILEDTLIGYTLEPFHTSIRKRQRTNPKFYFFDAGVKRALDRTLTVELLPQTYAYGKAFEHFVITEILRFNSYFSKDYQFSYLRTKDNAEIDLIVERPASPVALIEIKSTNRVTERDLINLKRFSKDFKNSNAYCLSIDTTERIVDKVNILHWKRGLKELGLINNK